MVNHFNFNNNKFLYWWWTYNGSLNDVELLLTQIKKKLNKSQIRNSAAFFHTLSIVLLIKWFFKKLWFLLYRYSNNSNNNDTMKYKISSAIIKSCEATVILSLFALSSIISNVQALDNGLALTPPMGWLSWQRYGIY